jgi:hypothetical protein
MKFERMDNITCCGQLTRTEDRRRFRCTRSGRMMSGEEKLLEAATGSAGMGRTASNIMAASAFPSVSFTRGASSDNSLDTCSISSSTTLFKLLYTGPTLHPHSPFTPFHERSGDRTKDARLRSTDCNAKWVRVGTLHKALGHSGMETHESFFVLVRGQGPLDT